MGKLDVSEREIVRDVEQFVKSNYLLDEQATVDHTKSLIGSGIIDSTGILELIGFLEDHYGIRFTDSELTAENFDSIARIGEFVARKKWGER